MLLADSIENDTRKYFCSMNIEAVRNAYGRQLGSFYAEDSFANEGKIPMTFIRAPYISRVGDGVEVLAQVDGKTVAARQGKQLVTAFHPELNNDLTVHIYFIKMINGEI
ncbi:hypothetical protein LCN94_02510 [Ruminococcus sp. FMB-CY1]|uniref:hypothetical protein n=1 Tax=unclassified Ruminococcus TaxID=2608920 RepID=UPI0021FB08BA|nr:hypothetical protein [Ruminococcus sp. FMBCY1]USP68706.1 hypothetical protein KGF34_05785 [Ruminococcus sp. FMBCY1]WBX57990.1 hypothetical protein LCN94_02510 [Ruminococcus sp. FMB-CY1]